MPFLDYAIYAITPLLLDMLLGMDSGHYVEEKSGLRAR